MKQTLFMYALELLGTVGVLFLGPIIAVAVYYFLGILRPQWLWRWAIPPRVGWSDYPALAAAVGVIGYSFGILPVGAHERKPVPRLTLAHWAFLAFGLWVCMTYFTALDQTTAYIWLWRYIPIFVMFVISALAVRTLDDAWTLYLASTLPIAYLAYHVNSLYVFDGRLDIYHNGFGGLDNNGAGLMLAMCLPLALSAWEAIRSPIRWAFVATIPFIIHAVLVSYSRGAMVSMVAIVPVLILRTRRRWQFLMVAVVLGAMIPTMAGREIRGRFFSIDNYAKDRTANSRFQSWAAAIRIANDYPLLGVGIRNANLLSHQYGADQEGRTIHSQYFQILADEGYPGLGLYLLANVAFFWNGWRVRQLLRKRTDHAAHRAICMLNGVEGAFFMFCVGGAFLSLEVFELPYFMLLIGAQICAIVRHEAAAVPVPVPAPSVAPTPILAPARLHQTAR